MTYYQVLGVLPAASGAEIKRAYRKLVQQYHPDVNPSAQAQELIKLINEAYEVLGDEVRRAAYDRQLESPVTYVTPQPPPHRDPAYRRPRPYRPPGAARTTQRDAMMKLMPYLKWISFTGIAVLLLLLADFFAPRLTIEETIVRFKIERYGKGRQEYLITQTGRSVSVAFEDFEYLNVGDKLLIRESYILRILLSVHNLSTNYSITNLATLYGNFIFLPVLLAIGSGLWLMKVGSLEFRFNLGLVNGFVLIFTVLLMVFT
jgi:curved DNA-binding protein CbpA